MLPGPADAYPPEFFDHNPVRRARELLGAVLVRRLPGGELLAGRVTETEAYDCPRDPSCTAGRFHAARSAELAAPPGQWTFWTAHGWPLLQVTCRADGIAASVLLRALEPLAGVTRMLDFRPVTRELDLTSGPGKLVQALNVAPTFRGQPVNGAALYLAPGLAVLDDAVEVTARIGIRGGRELPWRFVERGTRWQSAGPPSVELGPLRVQELTW